MRLPLFSCPFRGCAYATDDRAAFLRHLASPAENLGHYALVKNLCGHHFSIASSLDFVYSAISIIERRQIPCIGMATTRRALRQLTKVYNDDAIKALVCFVCGEIHCTMRGPELFDQELAEKKIGVFNRIHRPRMVPSYRSQVPRLLTQQLQLRTLGKAIHKRPLRAGRRRAAAASPQACSPRPSRHDPARAPPVRVVLASSTLEG